MQNIIELEKSKTTGIQWDTSIVIIGFHILAIGAFFTFSWQNLLAAAIIWWLTGSLGDRTRLSSAADARRIQNAEGGRVFFSRLRNARVAVGTDSMGDDAPHSSRFYRNRKRPAFTARRHVLGAYRLADARHGTLA